MKKKNRKENGRRKEKGKLQLNKYVFQKKKKFACVVQKKTQQKKSDIYHQSHCVSSLDSRIFKITITKFIIRI